MPIHGENIYKRQDGRYEGRYVVGKTTTGKNQIRIYLWPSVYGSTKRITSKKGRAVEAA